MGDLALLAHQRVGKWCNLPRRNVPYCVLFLDVSLGTYENTK